MIDPITRTVLTMIARWGGDATLVVTSDGEYNPETSTGIPVEHQYPMRMVAQDYIQKTSGLVSQAGGLIQTGDKQFFIQPAEGVPIPRVNVDSIIFEGKKWTPITVKDYNPSGAKSYLYEVYARL